MLIWDDVIYSASPCGGFPPKFASLSRLRQTLRWEDLPWEGEGKGRKMTFSQNPLSSRFWASGFWMSILSSANFKKDPPWKIFFLSVHAPATSAAHSTQLIEVEQVEVQAANNNFIKLIQKILNAKRLHWGWSLSWKFGNLAVKVSVNSDFQPLSSVGSLT